MNPLTFVLQLFQWPPNLSIFCLRATLDTMQSLLRRVVAGPRNPHDEANLDLCYVTDFLIATSGPSSTYPSRAYRNPLDSLVSFLDSKHGPDWAIWEFRAEGTGYPDSQVYNRIWHFPWPDHHPPPFRLVPDIMASMREWLHPADGDDSGEKRKRVVVVHCKAGKGRSGTAAVSYLMSEEGWSKQAALQRFTERRMRPGFGAGVSIPSQLRYVNYVERWIRGGKTYVEQRVEILEVHVWGLREGVKLALESYVDNGKTIKTFHVFSATERDDVDDTGRKKSKTFIPSRSPSPLPEKIEEPPTGTNTIFRPSPPLHLPSSDINLSVEKRSRPGYGLTMVTSVAHVWFNTYFEGNGPENHAGGQRGPNSSGVFEIAWDALDGIKGSSRKGARAFEKCAVVWRVCGSDSAAAVAEAGVGVVEEPAPGEQVRDRGPADWRGNEGTGDESAVANEAGQLNSQSAKEIAQEASKAEEEADSDEDGVRGIRRGVVV